MDVKPVPLLRRLVTSKPFSGVEQVFCLSIPLWWKGWRIHEPPLVAKLNHGKGDYVPYGDVVAIASIVLLQGFWRYLDYWTEGSENQVRHTNAILVAMEV